MDKFIEEGIEKYRNSYPDIIEMIEKACKYFDEMEQQKFLEIADDLVVDLYNIKYDLIDFGNYDFYSYVFYTIFYFKYYADDNGFTWSDFINKLVFSQWTPLSLGYFDYDIVTSTFRIINDYILNSIYDNAKYVYCDGIMECCYGFYCDIINMFDEYKIDDDDIEYTLDCTNKIILPKLCEMLSKFVMVFKKFLYCSKKSYIESSMFESKLDENLDILDCNFENVYKYYPNEEAMQYYIAEITLIQNLFYSVLSRFYNAIDDHLLFVLSANDDSCYNLYTTLNDVESCLNREYERAYGRFYVSGYEKDENGKVVSSYILSKSYNEKELKDFIDNFSNFNLCDYEIESYDYDYIIKMYNIVNDYSDYFEDLGYGPEKAISFIDYHLKCIKNNSLDLNKKQAVEIKYKKEISEANATIVRVSDKIIELSNELENLKGIFVKKKSKELNAKINEYSELLEKSTQLKDSLLLKYKNELDDCYDFSDELGTYEELYNLKFQLTKQLYKSSEDLEDRNISQYVFLINNIDIFELCMESQIDAYIKYKEVENKLELLNSLLPLATENISKIKLMISNEKVFSDYDSLLAKLVLYFYDKVGEDKGTDFLVNETLNSYSDSKKLQIEKSNLTLNKVLEVAYSNLSIENKYLFKKNTVEFIFNVLTPVIDEVSCDSIVEVLSKLLK